MLAGFDTEGQGTYERIIDDELGWMFKRASDAGLSVLVVVDACHSGTMTRGFSSPSQTRPRVRAATYPPILISDDKLPPLDPSWAQIPDDLPNVIYFGAVQDDEQAPEVTIDGKSRGALSWALAEGLRGAADANHDGIVTKEELQTFIKENIRMQLEGRQHPSVIPTGFRAFQYPINTSAQLPVSGMTPPQSVRLAIVNAQAATAASLASSLHNVVPVERPEAAKLVWDVGRRQVTAGPGNIVADFSSESSRGAKRVTSAPPVQVLASADGRSDLPRVQAVVDNWHESVPVPSSSTEDSTPIILAILNASTQSAPELVKGLSGVRLVGAEGGDSAALTWDVARRQVFSGLGDIVASLGAGSEVDETRAFKRSVGPGDAPPPVDGRADLTKLQGVVDKWRLAERIKHLAESRSLIMSLDPNDKLHSSGDKITFVIDGHDQTYFTLFNIAADGTINFLYPLNTADVKDPPQIPLGRAYSVPLVVDAPYGADHLVAIASAGPLSKLHKALEEFDGKPAAGRLESLLVEQLAGQNYRIGIHGSYTAATR